jgi:TolB-like protein/Flp pilus assembly protein TadD
MSLFNELKRRNVFRVGIAYAIAAWIILQVTDVIGEIMELPEWGGKLILLMVVVGFPLALILAWAFELTPEGIKREKDVDRSVSITPQTGKKLNNAILVLMALAIAYLLFDKFSGTRPDSVSTPVAEVAQNATRPETEPAPGTDTQASRQSIAVLPFDNRSNREEDQFFTDGIHDDLLTTIARIGSMKVISRTSVMEYKGTTKKIPEIARELGVANILEGGIQRSGNQVRINVQLIDAQTDEHLWAEIFDRELTAENLFAIQSEISTKIAEALQTTLSPEEQRGISRMPTQDLEAYDAYLRGKQLLATRRTEDIEAATRQFQRTVELDTNFALAWVGVADSFDLLANYTNQDSEAFMGIRQEAVDRALALQPDLGEAYTSLGALHVDRHRRTGSHEELAAAEAAFRRSIELSPNYATAYQWFSNSIIDDALRSRERLELAMKAVELDPRSAIIGANLANEYLVQGLFSRGEQQVRKLIEINPGFPNSYHMMVDHHLLNTGQFAKALANAEKLLELDAGSTDARRHQIEVYVEIGDFETARAIQDQITQLDPEDIWAVHADLLVALQTGNTSAARESLQWWASHFLAKRPWLAHRLETHYLQIGETKRAFELLLQGQPGWNDPAAWEVLVRQDGTGGCQAAWLMIHEGDETLGRKLLERALMFQEQELPGVIEHADRYAPDICYLAQGDTEKALTVLETALSHGHFLGWTRWSRAPIYDPIRLDPRFLGLTQERDRKVAAQRELIEQGGVEAGP